MKRIITSSLFFSVLFFLPFLSGCYYDKEEILYPMLEDGCDTVNISYSEHIERIMVNNCNGCHSTSFPQGGITTDNYDDLRSVAENGKFWGAINHEQGFQPMPKDRPKLPDCDLKQIKIWISEGYGQ